MTLFGSPNKCVCGAPGCVEVDGLLWLCVRCEVVINNEFKRSGFASKTPIEDANAPVSLHPAPNETGAINSSFVRPSDETAGAPLAVSPTAGTPVCDSVSSVEPAMAEGTTAAPCLSDPTVAAGVNFSSCGGDESRVAAVPLEIPAQRSGEIRDPLGDGSVKVGPQREAAAGLASGPHDSISREGGQTVATVFSLPGCSVAAVDPGPCGFSDFPEIRTLLRAVGL